jgi:hypothetical protein
MILVESVLNGEGVVGIVSVSGNLPSRSVNGWGQVVVVCVAAVNSIEWIKEVWKCMMVWTVAGEGWITVVLSIVIGDIS